MNLSGQETLPVTQAQAWAALNDTGMLKAAISGCESLTRLGENPAEPEYEALLTVAIGPVKAKFKGRLKLSDLQAPNSYQLAFEGSGGAAGHGKGLAHVRLESAAPEAAPTVLHYEVQASVGGKIAQIGSRLVDMAAQKMASDFFAAFNTALQAQYPPVAEALPPPTAEAKSAWQKFLDWYLGWLGRIFK
ncbi:carbon monoxide dehydrogenase subunit G [Paucibacter oligotrophus]|uniref:Carbon monoxide dehydrogenase subunit G n=1 Tax=Roseateles oligotrophus TaxID=1769250 RepID=A0A840LAT3_9BURK|nr:carbon monoxide dehydrogenase subunit G [Roseateles oligotrophus]MBB4843308.1 carbon monoxide dehydrogenase subunit G [Roseateles oligotrophus]